MGKVEVDSSSGQACIIHFLRDVYAGRSPSLLTSDETGDIIPGLHNEYGSDAAISGAISALYSLKKKNKARQSKTRPSQILAIWAVVGVVEVKLVPELQ